MQFKTRVAVWSLAPVTFAMIYYLIGTFDSFRETTPDLITPTIEHFLPHLRTSSSTLKTYLKISNSHGRNVTTVLGISTVQRSPQNYLVGTLGSILSTMSRSEKDDTLIVVLISETDKELVKIIFK